MVRDADNNPLFRSAVAATCQYGSKHQCSLIVQKIVPPASRHDFVQNNEHDSGCDGTRPVHHAQKVRFWRVTELITQLMEAREERQLLRMKSQLAKLDLLILDELGYVPASKLGAELLFDAISTACERTSLIATINLPFENWTEALGSERLTGATLDRLTHRCHILEVSGRRNQHQVGGLKWKISSSLQARSAICVRARPAKGLTGR